MTDWKQVKLDVDKNLPLYTQISEKLRSLILSGKLKKGDRLPSSGELQEVFRVSAITVENGISALVQEGLLLRRQRLGTFVAENSAAPRKETGTCRNINVVFTSSRPGGHSYFELLCEMERQFKTEGYAVRFIISDPAAPEALSCLAGDCAGIVLMGGKNPEQVKEFKRLKIPMVIIGDMDVPDPQLYQQIDAVVGDDAERSYHMVRHLVELGHRRIMAIITPPGSPFEANQKRGLERAAAEFGLSQDELRIYSAPDYLPECGYKTGYAALCSAPRPTACMTTDADLAVGVMRAAQELGLSIPADLSMLTFGASFTCMRMVPQLTCFKPHVEEMIRHVVQKMKNQLRNINCRKSITVSNHLEFLFGSSTKYYKEEKL